MDTQKLTKMELVKLAKILETQERAYSGNKINFYKPHEGGPDGGQLGFHRDNHKIRAMITGNRFGKSSASVVETIWLATGTHPYHPIPIPNRGKLYADSYPSVEENLKLKLEEYIPKNQLHPSKPWVVNTMGQLIGINYACGSFTRIGSYDQQTRKSEGSNWSYVGFDEPPSRELYIANLRGLVDNNGLMWFACTPLSEPWMYDEIYLPGLSGEKDYVKIFRGASDDNPNIDKDGLNLFFSELTPAEERVRRFGEFSQLKGLVIDTFNPLMSMMDEFELGDDFVLYEGIDPHPRKPHAVLWKAIHRSGLRFVVDELGFDGPLEEFAEQISEKRNYLTAGGARLVKSVADSSLNVKDVGLKVNLLDELKKYLKDLGETVMPQVAVKKDRLVPTIQCLRDLYRCVRHDLPSDSKGEAILSDFFREIFGDKPAPNQYVFKRCRGYKQNLLHYQWPDDPLDNAKPIGKHDDFIACDRYIETVAPKFQTPGQRIIQTLPKNYMQRDSNVYMPVGAGARIRQYREELGLE